jgi:mRNA interferase YafQ
MYKLRPSTRFSGDVKRLKKRGYDMNRLNAVLETLSSGGTLPEKNRDHALTGSFKGCRECHIAPDWLLIYEIDDGKLFLYLTRTGTHADLLE